MRTFGTPLKAVARGAVPASGWLFFKIDTGRAARSTLQFHRPAYEVSTTDKAIKATVIQRDPTE